MTESEEPSKIPLKGYGELTDACLDNLHEEVEEVLDPVIDEFPMPSVEELDGPRLLEGTYLIERWFVTLISLIGLNLIVYGLVAITEPRLEDHHSGTAALRSEFGSDFKTVEALDTFLQSVEVAHNVKEESFLRALRDFNGQMATQFDGYGIENSEGSFSAEHFQLGKNGATYFERRRRKQ